MTQETWKSVENSVFGKPLNFVPFLLNFTQTWPLFDLNNSWPIMIYDLIFSMKVSNWCTERCAKFGGATRRRLCAIYTKLYRKMAPQQGEGYGQGHAEGQFVV